MKDLFSKQSQDYAKYRPTYPNALFDHLASISPGTALCWDCGTGNGQAAVELAERFEKVIATDLSEKQLQNALPHPKIQYRKASAEDSGIEAGTVDLITVAQAFHWFDHSRFFSEALRVLKPQGVTAVWSYSLGRISPQVDRVVLKLYQDILGEYWEYERKWVDDGYSTIQFPESEIEFPDFQMKAEWTLDRLVGYLGTWSALQTYIKKNEGGNPLEDILPELTSAWERAPTRKVVWDLAIRGFRKRA